MWWFKFSSDIKFLEPVCFIFFFVVNYDNQLEKKEKNQSGLRKFKPKMNLNHNIIYVLQGIIRLHT